MKVAAERTSWQDIEETTSESSHGLGDNGANSSGSVSSQKSDINATDDAGLWERSKPVAGGQVFHAANRLPRDRAPNTASTVGKWLPTVTTVMLKNLHNKVTQRMLLDDLKTSGFGDSFDFMYLPIDPTTDQNRGYAFINFLTPVYAWNFKKQHQELGITCGCKSAKKLEIVPAALQGFEANHAHYASARVQRGPPEIRPLFLRSIHQGSAGSGVNTKRKGRRYRSLIDKAVSEQQKIEQSKTVLSLANSLEPEKQVVERTHDASVQHPRFCHQCGTGVGPEFRFCTICGAHLAAYSGGFRQY